MISDKHKCIFIHIPKTAGTSIENALGHFKEVQRGVQDHRPISEIEPVSFNELLKILRSRNASVIKRKIQKTINDKKNEF